MTQGAATASCDREGTSWPAVNGVERAWALKESTGTLIPTGTAS